MSKLKIFVASLMTIASLAVTPTTYASGGGSSHGQPAVTASHHRPPMIPPDTINGHSVIWSDNSSATSTGSIGYRQSIQSDWTEVGQAENCPLQLYFNSPDELAYKPDNQANPTRVNDINELGAAIDYYCPLDSSPSLQKTP